MQAGSPSEAGGKEAKGTAYGTTSPGCGDGIYIALDASVFLDVYTVDHAKRNKASTSNPNIAGAYRVIA